MSTEDIKEEELKAILKSMEVSKPSVDFEANVMNLILEEEKKQVLAPLVSKKGWAVAVLFVLGIVTAMYFIDMGSFSAISSFDYSFLEKISFNLDTSIVLSKTVIYSLIGLFVAFLIQVGFIKNYYVKQYRV